MTTNYKDNWNVTWKLIVKVRNQCAITKELQIPLLDFLNKHPDNAGFLEKLIY